MSENNPIRLYVTHLFAEHPDYQRVFEYLESASNFFYVNTARPDDLPSAGGKEAIKEAYREQIRPAEAVLVLAALYEANADAVTFQLDFAGAAEKPVIALPPFGGVSEVSGLVAERADEIIDWNERSIVDAIRREARHEDTTRWDVIDFP